MARVEDVLTKPSSIDSVLKCFSTAKANSFENLLDPLLKIVRFSTNVAVGLAKPAFFQRLTDRLTHQKAVVRLNLLKLLRAICDVHPDRASLVQRFGLYDVVERLSRTDGAVLVRELAREIVPVLLPGGGSRASKTIFDHESSNRSAGALLDSLDEMAKGRRPVKPVEPIFAPRRKVRRAASEVSTSPLLQPLSASPSTSTPSIAESGTAKKVRPIQRRSVNVGLGLNTNVPSGPSMRSAIAGTTSDIYQISPVPTPRRSKMTNFPPPSQE